MSCEEAFGGELHPLARSLRRRRLCRQRCADRVTQADGHCRLLPDRDGHRIGGGTIRDLLLNRGPVSWVNDPSTIVLCFAVAAVLFLFFTAHHFESRFRALLWADAVGLAVFCIGGAKVALSAGASALVAVLMGVMTATFGGILRDVLCAEVPLILRREIYATAAAGAI